MNFRKAARRQRCWRLLGLWVLFTMVGMPAGKAQGLEPSPAQRLVWPPEGHPVNFSLSKDTWLSAVGDEVTGSNGGSRKLKLKGRQEVILFDADLSGLKGKLITGAIMHVRSATPETAPFLRLGISTIATSWQEGSSTRYRPQKGSACYLQAAYGQQDWAYPGSTLMDVVFGRGHTIWKFADCTEPDPENRQDCAIDPDVIAARIAGLSSGFCVQDEVGSTWSLEDGSFEYNQYPNRFCYSKESGRSAPYLTIWVGKADAVPPSEISDIQVDTDGLPAGEVLVRWKTPRDEKTRVAS